MSNKFSIVEVGNIATTGGIAMTGSIAETGNIVAAGMQEGAASQSVAGQVVGESESPASMALDGVKVPAGQRCGNVVVICGGANARAVIRSQLALLHDAR